MSSSVLRVGDLVIFRTSLDGDAWAPDDEFPPGIVINVKRRETASPHPNYSGKHPPIELKVEELAEVMWPDGVHTHSTADLKRVKKKVKSK